MKRWGVVLLVLTVLVPNANAFELDPICHEYYEVIQSPGLTYEDVGRIAEAMYHKQCWPAMQGVPPSAPTGAPTATPTTRASRMRAFVPEFWRTMPVEVSQLCRRIMDEMLYAVAGQLSKDKWETGSYYSVVLAARWELVRETTTTDPSIISYLDWMECRELLIWGIDNRQRTQKELASRRAIEEQKAEQKAEAARIRAENKARRKRDMEKFKRDIGME